MPIPKNILLFYGFLNSAVEVFVFVKFDPQITKKLHNIFPMVCSGKQIYSAKSENQTSTFLPRFGEEIEKGRNTV